MTGNGSCLCGAVRFEFSGPARPVVVCHCTQCRKQTGSMMHATAVDTDKFSLIAGDSLQWFNASPDAARGFCGTCGSVMFWKPAHGRHISFCAGSINGPTGLKIEGHIFCADKGDYYEVPKGEGYCKQQWDS